MIPRKMRKSENSDSYSIERFSNPEITGFLLGETLGQPELLRLAPSVEKARKELMARAAVAQFRKSLSE
jgi:hypothetical protein